MRKEIALFQYQQHLGVTKLWTELPMAPSKEYDGP